MSEDFLSQEEIDALLGKGDNQEETRNASQGREVEEGSTGEDISSNLELILDFPLEVSVRLGNIAKTLRELRQLTPGNVIELNRYINDPVDIYVNGKLIARGEVVVIDENYAVKISQIIEPLDRIKTLK